MKDKLMKYLWEYNFILWFVIAHVKINIPIFIGFKSMFQIRSK